MFQPESCPGVIGSSLLCILTVWFAPLPALAEEKPQSATTDKQIAELILQLGSDKFKTRQDAQWALREIGQPAAAILRKTIATTTDAEIRHRATEIARIVDPGGERREQLKLTRAALLKKIEPIKGVDVKNWAESIANPFTELTADGIERLTAEGIDVKRLQKMRARYLIGGYGGANAKEFVNLDPETILVVGKGFVTHGGIYSAGPVLATENAYFMNTVQVANLLWFVDHAGASNGVTGAPVIAEKRAGVHAVRATPGIVVGDFGWRPPKNFLALLTEGDAKNDPPATKELAQEKQALTAEVKKAGGKDVTQVARPIANPFIALTKEGKTSLKLRGIDPERLSKLKAVYLTGSYTGANGTDLVNNDPDTVLVIGSGFITHCAVRSLGPVLAVGDAHFMGDVTGADIVWFIDRSFPRRLTKGTPTILAPTAQHSQMEVGTRHVWRGNYGWREPRVFPEFLQ